MNAVGRRANKTCQGKARCISHHPTALTSHAALPNATSCRGNTAPLQTSSSPRMLSRKKGNQAATIQYRPGVKGFIIMNGGCSPASLESARRMAAQPPVRRPTANRPPNAQSRLPALTGRKRSRSRKAADVPERRSRTSNQPPTINSGAKKQTLAPTNHITTGSCPPAEINVGMTTRVTNSNNKAPPPKRIVVAPSPSRGRDFTKDVLGRLTRPKISDRWRGRVWLQVECGNHRKLERGAASGSLHRLVRPHFEGCVVQDPKNNSCTSKTSPRRVTRTKISPKVSVPFGPTPRSR